MSRRQNVPQAAQRRAPSPMDTSWESPCPSTTILPYHGLITNQLSPSAHTDLRLHKPLGRGDWDCPTLCTKSARFLSLTSHCPQDINGLSLEPPITALFHKKIIQVASPAVLTCGVSVSGNPGGPGNSQFSSEAIRDFQDSFLPLK